MHLFENSSLTRSVFIFSTSYKIQFMYFKKYDVQLCLIILNEINFFDLLGKKKEFTWPSK